MERSPEHHRPAPVLSIKPNVLEKFRLRAGIADVQEAEAIFKSAFAQAFPIKLKTKDLPENMRRKKGGSVSYLADPNNPDIVYQTVTRGQVTTIEELLNFGTKSGRAHY